MAWEIVLLISLVFVVGKLHLAISRQLQEIRTSIDDHRECIKTEIESLAANVSNGLLQLDALENISDRLERFEVILENNSSTSIDDLLKERSIQVQREKERQRERLINRIKEIKMVNQENPRVIDTMENLENGVGVTLQNPATGALISFANVDKLLEATEYEAASWEIELDRLVTANQL